MTWRVGCSGWWGSCSRRREQQKLLISAVGPGLQETSSALHERAKCLPFIGMCCYFWPSSRRNLRPQEVQVANSPPPANFVGGECTNLHNLPPARFPPARATNPHEPASAGAPPAVLVLCFTSLHPCATIFFECHELKIGEGAKRFMFYSLIIPELQRVGSGPSLHIGQHHDGMVTVVT